MLGDRGRIGTHLFAVCKHLCFQLSHIATHGVCVFPVGLNDGKPKDFRQVYIIVTPHRHKHTHHTEPVYLCSRCHTGVSDLWRHSD